MFELQPDIEWDKGKAVLWLLEKLVAPMTTASTKPAATPANGVAVSANGEQQNGSIEGSVSREPAETVEKAEANMGESREPAANDAENSFFTIFIGDDKSDEVSDRRASTIRNWA